MKFNFQRIAVSFTAWCSLSLSYGATTVYVGALYKSYQGLPLPLPNGDIYYSQGSPFYHYRSNMSAFYLEDFEDHEMNTPGLTATTTNTEIQNDRYTVQTLITRAEAMEEHFILPMALSVDGDDGVIDGRWILGDSWYAPGLSLHFAPDAAGRYPNYAGLVITQGWPDGVFGLTPALEAYGPGGELLGVVSLMHNWFLSDAGTSGDTFLGFYADEGISRLVPTIHFAIQIDHVQYGWNIPEPATATLTGAFALALLARRRRCPA